MANTDHIATSFITPQYVGELIMAQGAVKTPFLNKLGGLGGGGAKRARGWTFAMNSHNALDASSQKSITEEGAITAPTPRNYERPGYSGLPDIPVWSRCHLGRGV